MRALKSLSRLLSTCLWPGLWRDMVLNGVLATPLVPVPVRRILLHGLGMNLSRCRISPGVWFGSTNVSIGARTFVNYGCMFDTSARVTIGARCDIGMRTTFVTATHKIGGRDRRAGSHQLSPITVGDGVWIGAGVTVLPGVSIGEGAIVAAGATVTADCSAHHLYAGVPARCVRRL